MKRIRFKEYDQDQVILFPTRLDEHISEDSPVRLVSKIVNELDISAITKSYKPDGSLGYDPKIMLKILFYSYLSNIYSCRKMESALTESIHFM